MQVYYMRVYSYLVTLTKNDDLAQELTQETFYKAFTAKSAFRSESEELTWLCAIGKNLFLDEKRRLARHTELPETQSADIHIESDEVDRDLAFRIHMALHRLDEPFREVFELRVFGELSFREIGTIFGKTESWARVTFHRARLKIKERMAE